VETDVLTLLLLVSLLGVLPVLVLICGRVLLTCVELPVEASLLVTLVWPDDEDGSDLLD
jgi:hypothetical protein